jgi:hypothetical protein
MRKTTKKTVRTQRAKRRFAFLKEMRRDTSLSSSAKMVVWALADDFYDLDTERCNPGFEGIAKAIGRSLRPTKQAIREAKDAGWIKVNSIGGGSKRCTNRYTLVWNKVANKPSTNQATDNVEETAKAPESDRARQGHPEESKHAEIIEEDEKRVLSTAPVLQTVKASAVDSTRTYSEPQRGEEEEEATMAARGFAAPPEEGEIEFQQLCHGWPRHQFYDDLDMAKCRARFAAIAFEHGEAIRAQGVSVGAYLLDRARVWVDALDKANDGNGGQFLKKLHVWLGAPDHGGNASDWWRLNPTAPKSGGRRKPNFIEIALKGAGVAS